MSKEKTRRILSSMDMSAACLSRAVISLDRFGGLEYLRGSEYTKLMHVIYTMPNRLYIL